MAASSTNRPEWKQKVAGASEIARWANVKPPMVNIWAKEEWFPEVFDCLDMGRVWDFQEVVAVLTKRGYPKELPYKERYPKSGRKPADEEEKTE